MIVTKRDKRVDVILGGNVPKGFPPDVMRAAVRKLLMLDAAVTVEALRLPPGNRLEALRGDREGQHSIHINQQWRICFVWRNGNAYDVEITDYH